MSAPTTETPELGQPAVDVKKPDDDDIRCWSVTTVIGAAMDKPGLIYWAAEQAAKAACAVAKTLPARLEEDGEDSVVKWLRDARFRRPKDQLSDAEFGTQIHKLAETYALTGTKPDVRPDVFKKDVEAARQCLDQFDRWLHEFQPEYQAAEVVLYSPTYGVAGTCDAFMTVGGTRLIVDYKASKKSYNAQGNPSPIYPETALQLAAYRWSELAAVWRPRVHEKWKRRYYLLSQAERDMSVAVPQVDGGLGIKITPEHCIAYPVRCDEPVHEAFLYCLEVARFQLEMSKSVVGDPLTPPVRSV